MHREADGADKAVAFERGMTDAEVAAAFETPGTQAFIVAETFLISFKVDGDTLVGSRFRRLYNGGGGFQQITDFLEEQARAQMCKYITGPLE
jgi:hypothetical protein